MTRPEHVAIIGAGITGALTAHRLLESGVGVTVIEARERGAGSSSRSAACIRQQFSTPATVRAMIYAVERYKDFHREFACAEGTADLLVQNGYLVLCDKPAVSSDAEGAPQRWQYATQLVPMQQDNGLADVELLQPEQVAERFPHIDTSDLIGATFCPSDGFLRPDLIYMEGFRRVEELGGTLCQNEEVIGGVHDSQGQLLALTTSKEREVRADLFINATNAWAPRVSRLLGGSELQVSPMKRYLYFIERGEHIDPELFVNWPMTITPSRAYCRPENRDQLLAGWAHSAHAEPGFDWEDQDHIEPEYYHRSGLDNYGYRLWLELAEALSVVGEFSGLTATTGGFYATTPDHNPLLGFDPRQPRLLHATGFSGHGAMMGPFTAAVIHAMALQGPGVRSLQLSGREVVLDDLLIGRKFGTGEGMVI
jgi:glycine/D-amino acid oxidase-like deaminating enzyme